MHANEQIDQAGEVSLKELIGKIASVWRYLRSQWLKVLLAGILGAVVGLAYAFWQPVKYTSRLTFVLEESKGGVGGLASLAGQFGFDIGGSGGGGIFNGDNILLFLKSQKLVRETLLSQFNNEPKTLADQYAIAYKLQDKWRKNEKVGEINFFKSQQQVLSRVEDSLIQTITDDIITKDLGVSRPDKKASFVEVKTTMRDESLSKLFCDRLVSLALEKYVSSKIKLKDANVKIMQRRADSLEALLNARTFNAAASQQSLLDINPGLRTMTAAPEIKTREKMTVAAIYTEVVKNLELSKTILNQETPTIEVVDQSSFPLKKEKTNKVLSAISIAFLFSFIFSLILLIRRWWALQQL